MKSYARAVVIGGGVIGCSMIYQLTRQGWTDVVLIEKGELTSGSTWHAAGQVPFYSETPFFARLGKESFDIYEEVERETGTPVGLHKCGSLRIARTAEEMLEYKRYMANTCYLGIDCELVGPGEAKALFPLLASNDFAGALYVLHDGWTDPSQTTNAIAGAARAAGAVIERHTRVETLGRTPGGEWRVETDKGNITAEVVINCAGLWGAEVSALMGGRLPVLAIEHEYLVTDTVPELAGCDRELPILRDLSIPTYVRQERDGLLVACYESETVFWGQGGIPRDFGQELLPPDLDRAAPRLEATAALVPTIGQVGVKTVVNGPTGRSPDLQALVGPAHGQRDYFVLCGLAGGFLQSSLTRHLAEWIIEGEPGIDLSPVDVRRFGSYANNRYAVARVGAGHAYSSSAFHPHSEPAAGRPARTSPLYDRLAARGAVFGVRQGWEVANWFAPAGTEAADRPSYHRANWFATVGDECGAVQKRAGVLDLGSLAKFEVTGAGAGAWLDHMSANRVPARDGGVALFPMLTPKGGIAAWFTIVRLSAEYFTLTSAATSQEHARDWLTWHLPATGVSLEDRTEAWGTLVVAGPKAREVLAPLTGADLGNGAFPWLAAREITLGYAPALALRMTGTGELGWEIHCGAEYLRGLYDQILEAGAAHGIADFGLRAFDSMRLEKGHPVWGRDIDVATAPGPAGLDRLVHPEKGDFIGRTAATRDDGRRLVCLTFAQEADPGGTDPWADEPVMRGDAVVGHVSSGGYGHRVGRRLALAWVEAGAATAGTALEIEILGERNVATVADGAVYDPENARVRA
jgi:dimethylglycine dehydrogenase